MDWISRSDTPKNRRRQREKRVGPQKRKGEEEKRGDFTITPAALKEKRGLAEREGGRALG
jgi:hypothetical protein